MWPGRPNRILYIGPPDLQAREDTLMIRTYAMSVGLGFDAGELARMWVVLTDAPTEFQWGEAIAPTRMNSVILKCPTENARCCMEISIIYANEYGFLGLAGALGSFVWSVAEGFLKWKYQSTDTWRLVNE